MACHAGIICLIVAFAADPVLGAKSVVRMVQRQKNVAAGTEKGDQTHTVVRRMNNKTKNALTTETDTAADQLVSVGPNGALSGLRRHRDAVHGNLQLEEDAMGKYVTVADVTFERSSGRDCTSADNVSVIRIDAITVTSVSQCLSACTSAQGCTCARYNRMFLECHLLSNCALPTFCARSSRFDMYVDTATDAPTESPTHAPTPALPSYDTPTSIHEYASTKGFGQGVGGGIALHPNGNTLYFVDKKLDLYRLDLTKGTSSITSAVKVYRAHAMYGLTFNDDGSILFLCSSHEVHACDTTQASNSWELGVQCRRMEIVLSTQCKGITWVDSTQGGRLYVTSGHQRHHFIITGVVSGSPTEHKWNLFSPELYGCMAYDVASGVKHGLGAMYTICTYQNSPGPNEAYQLYKINATDYTVEKIAGSTEVMGNDDGPADTATFYEGSGIDVSSDGKYIITANNYDWYKDTNTQYNKEINHYDWKLRPFSAFRKFEIATGAVSSITLPVPTADGRNGYTYMDSFVLGANGTMYALKNHAVNVHLGRRDEVGVYKMSFS